jgi:MoaA/NifB/PqqE/SkfB family radical SAM enzyme
VDILKYAHRKNVAISIRNGANLNNVKEKTLEALVKYKVRHLTCSVDGASPETYRTYRVRGDFDVVIRNIKTINAFKREFRSKLPYLTWQFVVFGHNEHEIPIARALAHDLGMYFSTKITWDAKFSPIRNKEFVRTQTGEQAITRDEFEKKNGNKYQSDLCHQLWNDVQINWNGKILGCCRNFWGDFGGNAFTDGLTESVNNEKMIYARKMLTGKVSPRDDIPCTTCDMYVAMRNHSQFIGDI